MAVQIKLIANIIDGKTFATYENTKTEVSGPFFSKEFICEAYLGFDKYTNSAIFTTSDGTNCGFSCKDVYEMTFEDLTAIELTKKIIYYKNFSCKSQNAPNAMVPGDFGYISAN